MSRNTKSSRESALFVILLLLQTTYTAMAAPVPIDTSGLDRAATDKTRFGLGGTLSIAQRPFIGVDDQTTSLPYIKFRQQDFYIEGINVGYTLYKNNQHSIDLLATPRFYEVKASFADDGELDGIDETKPTYLAGLSTQYITGPATLTLQLLADIKESDGYEFVLSASRSFQPYASLTIAPSIGVTYQDSALVDHFYGVQASEVTINRPFYKADASFNQHVTVTAIWQASEQIQLLGQLRYEKLGNGTTDSPIVDEDSIATSVIGAVYLF